MSILRKGVINENYQTMQLAFAINIYYFWILERARKIIELNKSLLQAAADGAINEAVVTEVNESFEMHQVTCVFSVTAKI